MCRSELARDGLKNAALILDSRVIVDDHREQARSYSFFRCLELSLPTRPAHRCLHQRVQVRPTSTAVTLYSGQLVAQSELSVVMTLAPDSGKWKVVYTTPGAIRSVICARSKVCPPVFKSLRTRLKYLNQDAKGQRNEFIKMS